MKLKGKQYFHKSYVILYSLKVSSEKFITKKFNSHAGEWSLWRSF